MISDCANGALYRAISKTSLETKVTYCLAYDQVDSLRINFHFLGRSGR